MALAYRIASVVSLLFLSACAQPPRPVVYYDPPAVGPDTATVQGTAYDPGVLWPYFSTAVTEVAGFTVRDIDFKKPGPLTVPAGKQVLKFGCSNKAALAEASSLIELKAGKIYNVNCRPELDLFRARYVHISVVDSDGDVVMPEVDARLESNGGTVVVPIFFHK
jgi:hypothetical protein